MSTLRFYPSLILRTPSASKSAYSFQNLEHILEDDRFKAAILLASVSLYNELSRKGFQWKELGSKEKFTLFKYYNRSCFRPTPFGMFAAVSVLDWGKGDEIELSPTGKGDLHVFYDQKILLSYSGKIMSELASSSLYRINPTIYESGDTLRFLYTRIRDNEAVFELKAISKNPSIEQFLRVFKNKAFYFSQAKEFMIRELGLSKPKATKWSGYIVEIQLIISDLQLNIVGNDYLKRISALKGVVKPASKQLSESHSSFVEFLSQKIGSANTLVGDCDHGNLDNVLYAIAEKRVVKGNVAATIQHDIRDALYCLGKLNQCKDPEELRLFRSKFKRRFDRQKVPLLLALDPALGLGYSNGHGTQSESSWPSKEEFMPKNRSVTNIEWTRAHELLIRHLSGGISDQPIQLSELEIEDLKTSPRLSSSIAVVFGQTPQGIHIQSAGGCSALALNGRFSLGNDQIYQICKDIASKETGSNPHVLFAEIGAINEAHADNINRREHFYEYEIGINSLSTLPRSQQIDVNDLYLSMENDTLILGSYSLKTRVIPRLSSAYNYRRSDLAVFRFLGDLQHEGLTTDISLSLHQIFPGLKKYPRVCYKNCLLYLARFYLEADDIKYLLNHPSGGRAFLNKLGIPSAISLINNDQKLYFNLESEDDWLFFQESISGKKAVCLEEIVESLSESEIQVEKRSYSGQYVTLLTNDEEVYKGLPDLAAPVVLPVQRVYLPGMQWVYVKFSCIPGTADEILRTVVFNCLKAIGPIKWFFVRYYDNGFQLRLRLQVSVGLAGKCTETLGRLFEAAVTNGHIWDYQIDTYQRELERYDASYIDEVEGFFHASSSLYLNYARNAGIHEDSKFDLALVSVHSILKHVIVDRSGLMDFCEKICQNLFEEFQNKKELKVKLDLLYRKKKSIMMTIVSDDDFYKKHKIRQQFLKLLTTVLAVKEKAETNNTSFSPVLISDLIHMHCNRIFSENNRGYELMTYYVLSKVLKEQSKNSSDPAQYCKS